MTDESVPPDRIGRYSHFSRGASIYWSPRTGAHEIYGAIHQRYEQIGWERSALGYPTSGEYSVPGGRRNDFEGGNITWSPGSGAVETISRPVTPPSNNIVLTGTGTNVVGADKPVGPMLARVRTTTPNSGYFSVEARSGADHNGLLANVVGPTDEVSPLDFGTTTRQTTSFAVTANTGVGWEITLIPLSAAGGFGRGQTIGESRSTVWHYVGSAGVAHIIGNASARYFGVTAYNEDTSYSDLLVNTTDPFDGRVPVAANQYLEITADGPWQITVS